MNLPNEDHVLRYVPWARLLRTEKGDVIGVLGSAFKLWSGEEYLSATWLEYFKCSTRDGNITDAIRTLRQSKIAVKP